MADKEKDLDPRYLDKRVVERYLKKGLVEEKEFQRHLKSLPDLTDRAAKVETEFTPEGELGPGR